MPNACVVYRCAPEAEPGALDNEHACPEALCPRDRVPEYHDAHVVRAQVAGVDLPCGDAEFLAEFLVLERLHDIDLEVRGLVGLYKFFYDLADDRGLAGTGRAGDNDEFHAGTPAFFWAAWSLFGIADQLPAADLLPEIPEERIHAGHGADNIAFAVPRFEDGGHRPVLHHDPPVGDEREIGIVRDEDHGFLVLPQAGDDPFLVDAGVLHFIEKQDWCLADQDRIGDQERPGLAAREPGHPHGFGNLLPGKLVCKRYGAGDQALSPVIPRLNVEGEEPGDGEIRDDPGALGDERDGFFSRVAHEVFRGFLAVDKDAASRHRVILCEDLDIVDERGFPRAGRPYDREGVARADHDPVKSFLFPVPAGPGEHRQFVGLIAVHWQDHGLGWFKYFSYFANKLSL